MDFTTQFPPVQEGKTLYTPEVSVFGMSLQGASHKRKDPPVPCQDFSDFRFMQKQGLLLAAIADGVGSCRLSHWGSCLAVKALLDSVEKSILEKGFRSRVIFDDSMNAVMKDVMVTGFRAAQEAVEIWADENGTMVYQLQSTLTLAIYDGKNVYHGHVGDDGIVALLEDGTVHMLTSRLKGEEASSVYPLQSGEKYWRFGKSAKPVAAFFMATDGVLDAFVANRPDYFGINYNNGIIWPFMNDAVTMLRENAPEAPEKAMAHYKEYMLGETYQKAVDDDLSLVAVGSNSLLPTAKLPEFSVELWQTIQIQSDEFRRRALNRKAVTNSGLDTILPNNFGNEKDKKPVDPVPPIPPIPPVPTPQPLDKKLVILAAAAVLASLLLGIAVGRFLLPVVSQEAYDGKVQELETVTAEYAQAQTRWGSVNEANQGLQEQVDGLTKENQSLKDQLAEQKQELDIRQAKIDDQQAQLEAQQDRIYALMDEYDLTEDEAQVLTGQWRDKKAAEAAAAQAAADAAAAEASAETLAEEPTEASAEVPAETQG